MGRPKYKQKWQLRDKTSPPVDLWPPVMLLFECESFRAEQRNIVNKINILMEDYVSKWTENLELNTYEK